MYTAVDMAPYAENGDVSYPEDSMGILVWGEDAPEGENTRERRDGLRSAVRRRGL